MTEKKQEVVDSQNVDTEGIARSVRVCLERLRQSNVSYLGMQEYLEEAEDAFYAWRGRAGTDSVEVDWQTFLGLLRVKLGEDPEIMYASIHFLHGRIFDEDGDGDGDADG